MCEILEDIWYECPFSPGGAAAWDYWRYRGWGAAGARAELWDGGTRKALAERDEQEAEKENKATIRFGDFVSK